MQQDLQQLLRSMEQMWEPAEEEWAFMELTYELQRTCVTHDVGERDFNLMRYKCPVCNAVFKKIRHKN